MNFSTSTKDPNDFVKNTGETFATCYNKYRDSYENSMADLPHATRITMLLRKVNSSDLNLYLQPMDPVNLIYKGRLVSLTDLALVSDLVLSKKTHSDAALSFFKTRRGPESAAGPLITNVQPEMTCYLSTERTHSLFDYHPTNIRSSHSKDADFAKLVTVIKTALQKISLLEVQRKLLQNEAELRSTLALISPLSLQASNAERLYVSMRWQATPLEKTIYKECYVTDRNINLVGLDRIDEVNLIQFPNENDTCQTSTVEPTNAGNLVRMLPKSLLIRRNQILPELSPNLPFRTH
ncbi:hypothetical protein ACTXT7_017506 [Hymenolepis weldensis]